jgi:hypothetical protein
MMKDATEAIERYVDNTYGDLITTGKPLHYKSRGWVAELKSDYPRTIRDDKDPHSTFVKFITLRELGEVTLSDNNEIEGTPRKELVERLTSSLTQWRQLVEEIILSTSSNRLAKIGRLKDTLNPIVLVVDHFSREGVDLLSYEEIRKDPRSKKMLRWLEFLEQIKLVAKKDDGFTYGNKFSELEKQLGPGENLTDTVISYIMQNYYATMRQALEIWRFDPYLHMETCYFGPSLQAGRLLYRKEASLLALYHKWYQKQSPNYRIRPILDQLQEVGLLEKEGEYWVGSKDMWKTLAPLKEKVPQEIAPLKA